MLSPVLLVLKYKTGDSMGVPKFYRWLSERYTKINEIVSDSALLPEFDHLYLDMNGIIHGCTHPNHMDIADVLSERDMMLGIMHYLDRIITQIVKPRVSVYMAIDGVAPRAKLNQQRSRRFRSAKDMAEATKDLPKQNNEDGSTGTVDVFDSNCITPGTEFMAKVSDVIKYFIRKKIKEDPIWRNLNVIFSGHEIPGEGEHKIMEHIRMMRSQPGYQPNTRHCIYGQDADLIMLGLVTHEPHFTILREVVDFTGGFRNKNALKTVKKFTKESDFQLLHLSVLREYLFLEFCKGAEYALERTIDDFVFLTFLVGNDFLPHLSTLDIGEGAFDLLFKVYKEQRPDWGKGNYLTQSGDISDPQRLENFLAVIGSVETEVLEQREIDDAAYIKKKRKWNKRDGLHQGPSDEEIKAAEDAKQNDYMSMMEALMAKVEGQQFVDGWTPIQPGQKDFKGRYYFEKLKLTPVDIKAHQDLRQAYVEGLMWCLAYYYRGCISWGWFYPYHYGPMLSDLRNLPKMFESIRFEVGKPVKPFQQLMACLPPASAQLVPTPYRHLMKSPESSIIDFYPVDFAVDMNGKKNPWEGVNLLPFIDIDRLLSAIEGHCPDSKLTPTERDRNQKGKIFGYMFDLTCTETIESPNRKIGLVDIVKCNSRVRVLPEYESEGVSFKPELIAGTRIPFPGFPSLNVLPIASEEVVPIGVNCFGMPSKYPTMTLKLHEMPQIPPVETLADNVLGKSLFINWPMMHEAKLSAISDATCEVRLIKGKKKVKRWNKIEADRWSKDSEAMMQGYYSGVSIPGSGGIQIGEIRVRLKLLPLQGMTTNPNNGSSKKLFGKEEADVPLQLALWQAPAPDPRFIEKGPMKLRERFPIDGSVILTKGKYRGCRGTIVGIADEKKVGVKVATMPPEIPFGLALARSVYESYITSTDASRILKLNGGLFGKITGSILFEPGKYDLGLNLKSGDGLCVAGYTRQKRERNAGQKSNSNKKAWDSGDSLLVIGSARTGQSGNDERPDERIQWEFTPKAIRLVNEYRQKFPQLFTALVRMPNEKKYDVTKVFGPNGADWLPVIREWLNGIESAKLPRTPISTDTMSQEAVVAVEKAADVRNLAVKKKGFPKESLIKIPGSALFLENSVSPTDVMLSSDYNDGEAPELGDRIVNLCASGIPFGARGTVVGIHQATTGCVEVVMDDEFVGGTSLQGLCSNFRGKLCVWAHVMKITVDNSKGLVEKMVPQGSGKAAVEKILADIEREVKGQQKNAASAVQQQAAAQQRPAQGFATPTRGGSTGRPRSDSASRGKLALSREAKGPPEKGARFTRAAKNSKGGLNRWRALMKGKKKADPSSNSNSAHTYNDATDASAGLKAMLGVSGGQNGVGKDPQGVTDASAGLKAVLGVGGPVPPPHPPNFGVPPPPQPPVPSPATAADKLMQLMTLQPQMQPVHAPVSSSFNFSYVEEGKDVPEPPPAPQIIPHFAPYPMAPQPMFHPMTMAPPIQAARQPPGNMTGLSDKEFPPLGGAVKETAEVEQPPAEEPKQGTQSKLVPSSALMKPGK
mmetsp:Transcript_30068/g.72162  ORF Transcript_30068/g.72162 Transcript_30068/m.72162 type:complete len:1544 (+) Transcript_30068:2-4633(+)